MKKQRSKTGNIPASRADKYTNIFTEIDISNWLSDAVLRSMYEPRLSDFETTSLKHEYDCLKQQIKRQIKFFEVAGTSKKQLKVKCILCNVGMKARNARKHCVQPGHIYNMMKPFLNPVRIGGKNLVEISKPIHCTICNVSLFVNPRLAFTHFQSESHAEKVQKFLARPKTWKQSAPEVLGPSRKNKRASAEKLYTNFKESLTSGKVVNKTCSSLNSLNVLLPSVYVITSNVGCGDSLGISVKKELTEGPPILTDVNSLSPMRPQVEKHVLKKSVFSCEFAVNIFTEINIFHWLSREVVRRNTGAAALFNFNEDHQQEIRELSKQLHHQMAFFKVEKDSEGHLNVNCSLCHNIIPINAARPHCSSSSHLFNMMNRLVDDENRNFLKNSYPLQCHICNFDLFNAPFLYTEHFENEVHIQKLREFHACPASPEAREQRERSVRSIKEGTNGMLNPNLSTNPETQQRSDVESKSISGSLTPKSIVRVNKKMLPVEPVIPLKNSKVLQSLPNCKRFEALATEIGFQINFFVVECSTENVICTLCKVYLHTSEVWEHIESKSHSLNMILPLINEENKLHLDYVNGNFGCSLCKTVLLRGQSLLQHFQSSHHISKLQFHNLKSEEVALNDECMVISQQPNYSALPSDFKNFKSIHETIDLPNSHLLSRFLHLASKIEREINVFVFESSKKLRIFCTLCKVFLPSVGQAIEHVQHKMHSWNAETYKKETNVDAWIPSACDNNWQFLWPVAEKLEVYCTLCCIVLSNKIPAWVQHFDSTQHCIHTRNLHRDLVTAELSFPGNKV